MWHGGPPAPIEEYSYDGLRSGLGPSLGALAMNDCVDDRRPHDAHAVPGHTCRVAGTAVFLVALNHLAVPFRSDRFAQFLIGGVSMVVCSRSDGHNLVGYARALERSRTRK
jgi:hypothetical protein